MRNFKNVLYSILCLGLSIVVGAAVYEHVAVIPSWAAGPPESLTMFQGEFGIKPGNFWPKIHPVVLLLFIAVLIFSWKSERRKHVLIPFVCYVLVLVATFTYYVPELLELTQTPYAESVNEGLKSRAGLWENLSLLRLLFIVVFTVYLLLGLTKGIANGEEPSPA